MANLAIQEIDGSTIFTVKVVPGSSKTAISGLLDKMLKIRISAAPEKGKANRCLTEFLAKRFNVKKQAVTIISGKTTPVKNIRISGISGRELLKRLGLNE
jgi:uncharacterized protein (TIGR00251 family)